MVNFVWENIFKKDSDSKDLMHILSENYLFETLSKSELKFVKEMVHVRNYRPGEVVFRQGEIGVGMYLIASGSVDILVEGIPAEKLEKQTVFVTRLGAGDFFGELSLVEENGRRTATAVSSIETKLIGFFKPDLLEIVERNPSTGVKIVTRLSEVLGKRLKETTVKVTELKRELRIQTEKV
ncbi:MAG: cyclic nucleotide-binding domain-containing protein [Bdellovibrionales bacterium]|nr:cyclic nucleotide-binding domain-containing protein [Bdellovibrionales bacterium]